MPAFTASIVAVLLTGSLPRILLRCQFFPDFLPGVQNVSSAQTLVFQRLGGPPFRHGGESVMIRGDVTAAAACRNLAAAL